MGIDVGFDLYPPITRDNVSDRDVWAAFWYEVKDKYASDPDVGWTKGKLVFVVGEHLALPLDGTKFRRFSSKVTKSAAVEAYIKEVFTIAERHFGKRVFYWSEYGDMPNVKYSWADVHYAERFGDSNSDRSTIPFSTVATAVLTGFEHIHVGMDGLNLKSCSFPKNEGYRIEQEKCGFVRNSINRMQEWTRYVQGYDEF